MKMQSAYVIEKNIPLPKDKRRPSRYPWAELQAGDSVLIAPFHARVYRAASLYAKRNGLKFICRTEGDGIRVWRSS